MTGGRDGPSCPASAAAGVPAGVAVGIGSTVVVVMRLSGEVLNRVAVTRSGDSSRLTAISPRRSTTGGSGATVDPGPASAVAIHEGGA